MPKQSSSAAPGGGSPAELANRRTSWPRALQRGAQQRHLELCAAGLGGVVVDEQDPHPRGQRVVERGEEPGRGVMSGDPLAPCLAEPGPQECVAEQSREPFPQARERGEPVARAALARIPNRDDDAVGVDAGEERRA